MFVTPGLTTSSPPHAETVIVGAGLAGLSCAYHLRGSAVVIEADGCVGGTARSFALSGFTFDITGHWLHLRDARMAKLVEHLCPDGFVRIQRRAKVYSHNKLTAYPFQAHTYGLPANVVADCLLGYIKAREALAKGGGPAPSTFEQYIRQCMGDGIADHFMVPYNTKLWTVHPREMAHSWCGRFVPLPEPEEVVYGAIQKKGAGRSLGYNASFLYPKQGGIGGLAQALAQQVQHPVQLNVALTKIDWRSRKLTLSSGAQLSYSTLVATLPLTSLIATLIDPPTAVVAAAAQLRATQVTFWSIGLAGEDEPEAPHWIYYPEADVPFFRVGRPSAVRRSLAPLGQRSLVVEVAHPQGTECAVSCEQIWQNLVRVGLVLPDTVRTVWHKQTLPCAYVIMDHAYGAARATLLAFCEQQGITGCGRFGAWTYDSMEGALLAGAQVASAIDAKDSPKRPECGLKIKQVKQDTAAQA